MQSISASLLLVWMLLLGPLLCMGGFVEHAGECAESVACEHEEACSDAPCVAAVRVEERDAVADFDFEGPRDLLAVFEWDAPRAFDRPTCAPQAHPPDPWRLPYSASDRPLLI